MTRYFVVQRDQSGAYKVDGGYTRHILEAQRFGSLREASENADSGLETVLQVEEMVDVA